MKTAREIIAGATVAEIEELPVYLGDAAMWTPKELHEAIEETIEACAKAVEICNPVPPIGSLKRFTWRMPTRPDFIAAIRSLPRSTREGKAG